MFHAAQAIRPIATSAQNVVSVAPVAWILSAPTVIAKPRSKAACKSSGLRSIPCASSCSGSLAAHRMRSRGSCRSKARPARNSPCPRRAAVPGCAGRVRRRSGTLDCGSLRGRTFVCVRRARYRTSGPAATCRLRTARATVGRPFSGCGTAPEGCPARRRYSAGADAQAQPSPLPPLLAGIIVAEAGHHRPPPGV